jgi:hypothetical protein
MTAEHIRMHCLGLAHSLQQRRITRQGRRVKFLLVRMEMRNCVVIEEHRYFSSDTNFSSTVTLGRQSDPAGHIRHEHLLNNLRRPTFGSGVRFWITQP